MCEELQVYAKAYGQEPWRVRLNSGVTRATDENPVLAFYSYGPRVNTRLREMFCAAHI